MEMIRDPPGEPSTATGCPSRSRIVGDIEDNGRFPGAIEFASPCTSPNRFGTPGFTVKSSISLFSRNPVPGATTPAPNPPLIV